jgi:aminomuconate-semialdehyde/2-hydroxymuconate-6-semialdehyde dehydrogenase
MSKVLEQFDHIIGGTEVPSVDGARFPSVNPYTREPWAEVALGSAQDAELAVSAAREAFDHGPWPRLGYAERQRLLHRLADLMIENARELAMADTRDMGKPIQQAMHDVERAAWNFRFFADHARLAEAAQYPMDSGHHAYSVFKPAGVVVAIAPWNFPLMLESWKVAPALAWGNTVVLKPAEDTPVSGTILGRLALEAGIPPGVLNVVHGFGPESVGEALTKDPRVDRITFTGESGTGRIIARAAADNLTPVSLELGGKNFNIVFDDADLDNAVDWSIQSIFRNAGQICLSGSRILVQRGVYEQFLERFVAAADKLVIGDPMDAATQFGPVASQEHFAKVRAYVDSVDQYAGRVLTGGVGDGWLVRPTILVDMPADSPHVTEEIFGPVAVVQPFDSEADALALANASAYGLDAQIFTANLNTAHRVADALSVGTVWVNCFFVRDLRAPFGGVGDSGVGREGGSFSREFFTEPKAVVMQIDRHSPSAGGTDQEETDASR